MADPGIVADQAAYIFSDQIPRSAASPSFIFILVEDKVVRYSTPVGELIIDIRPARVGELVY